MRRWTVKDVMTEKVVSVAEETPYKEIVEMLARHAVSAVPVVDRDRRVLGVVSEADLLHKVEFAGLEPHLRVLERKQRGASRDKASAEVARELMSSPAVVIGRAESVPAAAKLMDREKVKRLPVVDEYGRLTGIVSRRDLLKMYLRGDEAIRDEIIEEVLVRTMWIEPEAVSVTVERGVVTLGGTTDRRSTAEHVARLVASVAGVVDVVDQLGYGYDDTAEVPSFLVKPTAEDVTP
jgi:CBS domain-containing protein/PII-like signaling protein